MSAQFNPKDRELLQSMGMCTDDTENHCRRSDGTLRAWFATAVDAAAFAENPLNTPYHGDIAVRCLKPGCDGWHLSQPHWPDAEAAVAGRACC